MTTWYGPFGFGDVGPPSTADMTDSLYAAARPASTHYYTIYAEHYTDSVPDEPKRAVEIHVNSRKLALNWTQDLQIAAFEDGLTIRYFFEEEAA